MNQLDVSRQPGAFRAARRPNRVSVEFADTDGTIDTLEGPVRCRCGDALVTGMVGERWPVQRERFLATYDPAPGTESGAAGQYIRRVETVWAWRTDDAADVVLSGERGTLHARAGDVIVQFESGDKAVMTAPIFKRSYQTLD